MEEIKITIDPKTLDYTAEFTLMDIEHIEHVLKHLLKRIENQELGCEMEIMNGCN